jgi:hypothetical protein
LFFMYPFVCPYGFDSVMYSHFPPCSHLTVHSQSSLCYIRGRSLLHRGAGIAQSVWWLATGLEDQEIGVGVLVGSRTLSSPHLPDRLWGPPGLLSSVYRGVKWPGREADHSPTTSAEVKKTLISTSTPHTPSWHSA